MPFEHRYLQGYILLEAYLPDLSVFVFFGMDLNGVWSCYAMGGNGGWLNYGLASWFSRRH
jgi:hypothetical protein